MFGLSFLYPLFLAGLTVAAVPIVLHLLRKEEAPEIEFSAVRFIRRARVERSRRHRLRDLILLALRITALAMLAFSFARPYFAASEATAAARATIVAVDVSFSMATGFASAQALARQAVEEAPLDAAVGVIAFDETARVVAPPNRDRRAAIAAIDGLRPGYGGTRYAAALAAAATAVGARPGTVVVVSDRQRSGWHSRGGLPESMALVTADATPASQNLAVVALRHDPRGLSSVVTNFGGASKETLVTLRVDGAQVEQRSVTLAAGQTSELRFERVPDHGVAAVSLVDPGGLPADDTRYAVLDPPPAVRVALVTGDALRGRAGFFVEQALGVPDRLRPATVRLFRGTEASQLDDTALHDSDVVVVLGTRGLDRRVRERLATFLSGGGGLLGAAGPNVDVAVLAEILGAGGPGMLEGPAEGFPVRITPTESRHPIFAVFEGALGPFGAVQVDQAVHVEVGAGGREIARFTNGWAGLAEYAVGRGRALILMTDLDAEWNDLPRRASFLPLIKEAVRYLGGVRAAPGEELIREAPPGIEAKPGPVEGGRDGRPLVLNVDADESNPSQVTLEEFRASVDRVPAVAGREAAGEARRREEDQALWRYGLALMALVLVIEGVLGRLWASG